MKYLIIIVLASCSFFSPLAVGQPVSLATQSLCTSSGGIPVMGDKCEFKISQPFPVGVSVSASTPAVHPSPCSVTISNSGTYYGLVSVSNGCVIPNL